MKLNKSGCLKIMMRGRIKLVKIYQFIDILKLVSTSST